MDDPKKSRFNAPPVQPEEEEPIIDLIDEVPAGEKTLGLSDLEKNLLEFERRFGAGPAAPPAGNDPAEVKLPDLDELEDLNFEEEDEALTPAASEDKSIADLEQHLDWLFAEESPPPAAAAPAGPAAKRDEVIEIAEFEEQFLDAEEIPLEPAAAARAPEPEEDEETLELLEVEEDAPDDELIWFDTPATTDPSQAAAEAPAPETDEATAAPGTPAADTLFSGAIAPAAAVGAAASAVAAPAAPAPAVLQPDAPQPAIDLASIPMDRIEAAVANVIERTYSGRIEMIIRQAVEKAVTREIERLKNELLESEAGGRLF
jgi:hypothetical protein